MKPPKNFYSNLDRRKQGLPELPEASAADAEKIIKVGDDGSYELGKYSGLPDVTSSNVGNILQVNTSGEWSIKVLSPRGLLYTGSDRGVAVSSNTGVRVNKTAGGTLNFFMWGATFTFAQLITTLASCNSVITIIDSDKYYGYTIEVSENNFKAVVEKDNVFYIATITSSSITYTPVRTIKYYEIETSGSSVSLPSGVTFADVYAELQAGVDVRFTSGARVYTVTSFESTNIRAHWISDLDLTSIEVYVINLASDGTGTVASATFSGS